MANAKRYIDRVCRAHIFGGCGHSLVGAELARRAMTDESATIYVVSVFEKAALAHVCLPKRPDPRSGPSEE